MIDFACKQFDIDEIIKCGLGLTKAEHLVFNYFVEYDEDEFTTQKLSKILKLNQTTVQKAVKKLASWGVIKKHQNNLKNGGYEFTYICSCKKDIRKIIKDIINNWSLEVHRRIDLWG